jgi:hypothetical protein
MKIKFRNYTFSTLGRRLIVGVVAVVVVGIFTLPFATGEWCISTWPELDTLNGAEAGFIADYGRPVDLAALRIDRSALLNAAAENKLCTIVARESFIFGERLRVICSIHGTGDNKRWSSIEYKMWSCGWKDILDRDGHYY